jgi:hypothetical protein
VPLPFAVLLCGLALGAPSGGVALQAAATPPGPATSPAPGPAATPAGVGWVLPLGEGTRVARPFDPPPTPYAAGHRGVDLLAVPGAAVRAAAPGVVTFAGVLAGRGVVTVSHGALRSTYEPVDATVTVGQHVAAGDVIGHVSAAAGHCGPRTCLHWGVLRGAAYLDPLGLLRPGRVRLLPVWGVPVATQLDSVLSAVTDAVISTGLPERRSPRHTARAAEAPARAGAPAGPGSGTTGITAGALGLTGAAAGALALRRRG